MDNLFDYIIIFAIIVSIYNALFGKKKQQKKVPQKTDEEKLTDAKRDSSDFLEQLFGIPSEKKKPEYEPIEEDEYTNTWDPEAEFGETVKKPEPPPRRTPVLTKAKLVKKPASVIEHDEPEISISSKIMNENVKRKEIINSLMNPNTIRDYILVSEILNKPKALSD